MALTPEQQELADIDAELAKRGVSPKTDELAQIDAELARRKKQSTASPAVSGMVDFGAGLVGAPVDAVQNAINLSIAGYGTAKGLITGRGGDSPEPLQGSFGGSQSIRSGMRTLSDKTGLSFLSPDNPNPKDDLATLQYDMASRGGFIPGGVLPAVGSIVAEKIGGPQWAPVGAMLPSAGVSAYNELTASGRAKAQARNQVRDATLKDAREEGYVTPPSQSNPSFVGNRIESVAGKAAVKQEAAIRNQEVTDAIARREVGLPENAPLTVKALQGQRDTFAEPYREVASLSSRAKVALEQLKQARHDSNTYWKHYDRSADPNSLAAAKSLDQKAGAYERVLEQEAARAGKPNLIPELKQARTNIAKTYDVERALNLGDGTVDARVLGRVLDNGKQLSGGLETVAKFAQGPGAQVTRPSSVTQAPGVSALEPAAATIFGLQGGAAAAGLPLLRGPTRHMLLSDWYQNRFGTPNYSPAMQPENNLQSLFRTAVLENK